MLVHITEFCFTAKNSSIKLNLLFLIPYLKRPNRRSVKKSRYEFACRYNLNQVNQSADPRCVDLSWL